MTPQRKEPYNLGREEFANWCYPTGNREHRDAVHAFFMSIKWPEGYTYCSQSHNYAKITGYDVIHRQDTTD